MAECKQEVFEFQAHGSRKVTADFSGGYLSSDGGAVFLRGVDYRVQQIRAALSFAYKHWDLKNPFAKSSSDR